MCWTGYWAGRHAVSDLQQALEKALFDRLTAAVTLATVFQHVPENHAPPVVIIADMNVDDQGSKDAPLDRFEFEIVAVVHGPARAPLNALQAEIRAALDRWQPAPAGAVTFGAVSFLTGSGNLLPEEIIYYGTQRFACFVQG